MAARAPLTTDAEFEVVSGPLPTPELAVPPSPRRYNVPKIAWQIYVWGGCLAIAIFALLVYFGPRHHFEPKTPVPSLPAPPSQP
jgi:hypothetical protein